jgi:hypothetical protein
MNVDDLRADLEPHTHLIERLLLRSNPRVPIYHYTTPAGLVGIATTRSFWASDIRVLNDASEFTFAVDSFTDALNSRRQQVVDVGGDALWSEWQRVLGMSQEARAYIVSFCEDGDLLSQWRAYGGTTGFAVAFNNERTNALTNSLPDKGGVFRCCYERAEQHEIIAYSLTHLLTRFTQATQALPNHRDEVVYNFGRHFLGQLLITAAIFKHPSFAEEKEWRLILRAAQPKWPASDLQFRAVGSRLMPYLELAFPVDGLEGLVEKIVVGPNPNSAVARKLASEVFEYAGFGTFPVQGSAIPFRDW